MPKKKSSRPAASLGSNQNEEPKSASQIRRERVVRMGAIVIVLALLLSLLAGAFSVTPSQAAEIGNAGKSVQILQTDDSPVGAGIDTDGDGIINNEDPDIDNDGIVNANDGDIDGDGTSNFDDGDPASTNGFDGNPPSKPGPFTLTQIAENGTFGWIVASLVMLGGLAALIIRKRVQKVPKNQKNNL